MKALILCGGRGTRLQPLTYSSPKQLLPVANRPILFHILDMVAALGIRDVIIIIGSQESPIPEAVGSNKSWDLEISYITQEQPLGLADAVRVSQNAINGEPFLMILGDNLYVGVLGPQLKYFIDAGLDAQILVKEVSDPQNFGIANVRDGQVLEVVEKPKHPKSNLALIGIYFFTEAVFNAIQHIIPSARGELEITDAIQWMLKNGNKVSAHSLLGWWKDTGRADDLLEANRFLLDCMASCSLPAWMQPLSKTANLGVKTHASIIRQPVLIGKNCRFDRCHLGPWVSVGDGCFLKDCHISNSVLLPGSRVIGPLKLTNSLIGANTNIHVEPGHIARLLLADHSQIVL